MKFKSKKVLSAAVMGALMALSCSFLSFADDDTTTTRTFSGTYNGVNLTVFATFRDYEYYSGLAISDTGRIGTGIFNGDNDTFTTQGSVPVVWSNYYLSSSPTSLSANVDASNIGKYLKASDGTSAASSNAITDNENAWGDAIGTGRIELGNKQLVTGGTVYDYLTPPSTDEEGEEQEYTYISADKTTGQNLAALDEQVGFNETNIENLSNGNGFTNQGKQTIKSIASGAVKVKAGDRVTVAEDTDDSGAFVYTISAKTDGKVVAGDTGLVSGDAVHSAIVDALSDANLSIDSSTSNKVNIDASNIGENLKDSNGSAAGADAVTANEEAWGKAIGTGSVVSGDTKLVTGGSVYSYLALPSVDENGESATYSYISPTYTIGKDLAVLDTQVAQNANDISGLSNGNGFTSEGNKYIQNLARDSISFTAGPRVTVTPQQDKDGKVTYTISANNDGVVVSGNTNLVSGDTVYKSISAEEQARKDADAAIKKEFNDYIQNVSTGTDVSLALKANADASNIGNNYKNADGSAASTSAVEENKDAWGKALGGGTVSSTSEQLVTGKTVYNELRPADGTYVKKNQTIAQNLSTIDQQVAKNTSDISSIKNLSNISDEGKDVIKEIAKDTVKVKAGDHVSVTAVEDKTTGSKTYTVSAVADGKVAENDTGLVNGGAVYDALHKDTVELGKDASAFGMNSSAIGNGASASGSDSIAIGTDSFASAKGSIAMGDGSSAKGTGSIALGDNSSAKGKNSVALGSNTVATEDNTVAVGNRRITQVADAEENSDAVNYGQMKKAIEEGTSIKNLSDENKQDLKTIVRDTVKVADGDNTTVFSETDKDGNITYKVHAVADGKIEEGNKEAVSGDAVKTVLDTKANADASNVSGYEKKWAEKLGVGEVKEGNTYLVTGDSVYKGVTQIINDTSLVKSSGDTLTIGASDSSTKIDVHNADGKRRMITGVVTDASDPTSAANVSYVDKTSEGLMRGMESMRHELKSEIYDSTAKAGAIAALHPQTYDPGDKLEFAAGFGHYHGSNATALGAFYHLNEDIMFNVGATVGAGSPLVTGGLSIKVGAGNSIYKSRDRMASEIVSLKSENNDLRSQVKSLEKQMAEVRIMLGSLRNSAAGVSAPANTFNGDKELTRYEYAQQLYNALQRGRKVDYAEVQEYGPELRKIQVENAERKLSALKKKAANSKNVKK